MSDKEEIIQGGVPPEAAEALIPADPVDQNKPPDNQVALQTDSGQGRVKVQILLQPRSSQISVTKSGSFPLTGNVALKPRLTSR